MFHKMSVYNLSITILRQTETNETHKEVLLDKFLFFVIFSFITKYNMKKKELNKICAKSTVQIYTII